MTIATSTISTSAIQLPRRYVCRKSLIASSTFRWLAPLSVFRRSYQRAPATPPGPIGLALGVLRRLASSLEPVLLALLGARIARQQARVAQGPACVRMGAEEGTGDAVPDRAGLARKAAAGDQHRCGIAPFGLGDAEGQPQRGGAAGAAEVVGH